MELIRLYIKGDMGNALIFAKERQIELFNVKEHGSLTIAETMEENREKVIKWYCETYCETSAKNGDFYRGYPVGTLLLHS